MPDKIKYADRAECLQYAIAKRREDIKVKVIEHKGGKCAICGYSK